jgi:hypothetical protein
MARVVVFILGFLLLAVCDENAFIAAGNDATTKYRPDERRSMVSPLLARNAAASDTANKRGWYFDFPTALGSVHYVVAGVNIAASSSVDASISVTTTTRPVFVYNLQSDNTCIYPAHVRLLLQEMRDDLSGRNGKQYFRWWSTSVAYQLASGRADLSASLSDLSQWVSVFGEKANASAGATAGFKQAMANLGNVGFAFGGGCFYGHGVRLTGGSARFAVANYTAR